MRVKPIFLSAEEANLIRNALRKEIEARAKLALEEKDRSLRSFYSRSAGVFRGIIERIGDLVGKERLRHG